MLNYWTDHPLFRHLKMLQNKPLPIAGVRRFSLMLCAWALSALAVFAQPGTVYTTLQQQTRSFSDPLLWPNGEIPPDSSTIFIVNSQVTFDADRVVGKLVLNSGTAGAILGSHTLTVLDQLLNNSLNGVTPETSTVILKSTVASGGSGQVTVGGNNDVTFYNVVIPTNSVVDFDSGGASNTETYITNQLKMDGGSVVVNPPIYGAASTLLYDDTHTSIGTEWTAGASSGKGVPHHVAVGAGSSLDFGSTSDNYTCTGNLTIDGASASLDVADMTGTLTVDGNLSLGTSNAVTMTLPSAEGTSKIVVGGDLTLGANTTVTGDESNIEVGGNLANSVSNMAFGLLKMNGSADQDVTGSKITVDSLVVANTQNAVANDTDVDFQADVDIIPGGVFNPIDGTTKISGTFTMNSDATGTARIATLADDGATSDVDGSMKFERYISAITDGPSWLSVGNYVIGANRGDWLTSFNSDFHLVFDWDETHTQVDNPQGTNAWTIIDASNVAQALHTDGKGYAVYTTANSSPTLTAMGTYNTDQQDLAVTFSNGANQGGGWHIVTNPFPSAIDGAEFLSDNSSLISGYYMYDNANDIFKTDLTGAPATIDIGQAFWVQVSGAGSLSFETDQITAGSNSFLREFDPLEVGMIGVRIAQSDGLYGNTFVRLHEGATANWEWELDATRRASGNTNAPEIFSRLENGHELLINALNPSLLNETMIPFTVETGADATVSIQAEPDFNLPQGMCAYIEDTETGERVGYDADMALVVDLEPQTTYTDRFALVLMGAPSFEATASHCEGGVVHFIGDDAGLWDITWSDTAGTMDGVGCVTGLDAGDYIFEASNPLNECHTSALLNIEQVCMGDFNFNGERGITDLLILLVAIQPVENFEGTFPDADCDCDGAMTTLDLLLFLPQFGVICE